MQCAQRESQVSGHLSLQRYCGNKSLNFVGQMTTFGSVQSMIIKTKFTYDAVSDGMGPLINTQKSVFLPLWDNFEMNSCKILHIESFSAIESEKLVKISKFFV